MLTDQEKSELNTLLENHVLKKAFSVLAQEVDTDLQNGDLAPELAVHLAYEKGVKDTFRLLQRLSRATVRHEPVMHRRLSNKQQPQ